MSRRNLEPRYISSLQNPTVKDDRRLMDRRHRDRLGLMSVEGFDELKLALRGKQGLLRLYTCPELFREGQGAEAESIASLASECFQVSRGVMEKLSYRQNPDGWFAVFTQLSYRLDELPEPSANGGSLYLVAEDLEKPGNLGALFRSADAAGASALIVSQGRTDLSNPNVVRSSKGVNFTMPCAQADNFACYEWLSSRNIHIVIADPGEHQSMWEADLSGSIAVVLGTEHEGLSDFWRDRADMNITIPMFGRVNSLNVAQAGTLLMYEWLRRRV